MLDETAVVVGLDRLLVAATSYRRHRTDERDRIGADLASVGRLRERCVVQTCHRTELIAVAEEAPRFEDGVHVFKGRAAVERVFVVAAGLDSAIVAEEQVLGQVRDAYTLALARGETGPMLNELLRRAVRFGKRVRSFARPTVDRSLADRAARWALTRIEERAPAGASALVVGTGEMGRLLATRFAEAGVPVTLASRNIERALTVVEHLPGADGREHRAIVTSDLGGEMTAHAVLALAVRRPAPLLNDLDEVAAGMDVIDLSSPPAVGQGAAEVLGDRLLDLDRLGDAEATAALSPRAEHQLRTELAAEVDRYVAWLVERADGSDTAGLRRNAEEVRARHFAQLRGRIALTDSELAAVEKMTMSLVAELVHLRTTTEREQLLGPARR